MKKRIAAFLLIAAVWVTVFSFAEDAPKKFIVTDQAPYTVYTHKDAKGNPLPLALTPFSLPVYVRRSNGNSQIALNMQLNRERTALRDANVYRELKAACERYGKLGTLYIELGGVKYTPVLQEKCSHDEVSAKKVDETTHKIVCAYCEKALKTENHVLQNGICEACGYGKLYDVKVNPTTNGSVTVTPEKAAEGETVTITVKPDPGYVLKEIIITDAKGNRIPPDPDSVNFSVEGKDYAYAARFP